MSGVRGRHQAGRWLVVALTVIALVVIYGPVAWLLISSLSTRAELLSVPPHWIPQNITFENYYRVFTSAAGTRDVAHVFRASLLNSTIVAGAVTLISLCIGTLSGYAFSRIEFRGRQLGLLAIIGTRMLPEISIVVPLYIIAASLDILDTKLVLILLYLSYTLPFVVWMMASFFETLPREIEDAALIDGCSRLQALWRVILPISGPGLASTAIFAFLLAWDEFFFALIFTSSEAAKTVPVAISEFTGRYAVDYTAMATGGVLAAIPAVLLAVVFQRYIVKGLTAGAVKG